MTAPVELAPGRGQAVATGAVAGVAGRTAAAGRWGRVAEAARAGTEVFEPEVYRVVAKVPETPDVVTLHLAPLTTSSPIPPRTVARPGQFNMLSALGVGEVAISVSGVESGGTILHTVRAVGPVSTALYRSEVGGLVGVRGPFGSDWGVDDVGDADVVVLAGGIGLAPLRMAVQQLLERAQRGGGRLFVLIGARSPADLVYVEEYANWDRAGADVALTVDTAEPGDGWRGPVGLVTSLVPVAPFDPARCVAMICGPEIMMRFSVRALFDRGVDVSTIRVSLERNMQCGVGLCGHCQLGPLLLCRDGPVVGFAGAVPRLLGIREL